MIQKLRKIISWLSKKLNRITTGSCNSSPSYIPQRIENKHSKKFMYTHGHSSTVQDSQKVEIVQMPINS